MRAAPQAPTDVSSAMAAVLEMGSLHLVSQRASSQPEEKNKSATPDDNGNARPGARAVWCCVSFVLGTLMPTLNLLLPDSTTLRPWCKMHGISGGNFMLYEVHHVLLPSWAS